MARLARPYLACWTGQGHRGSRGCKDVIGSAGRSNVEEWPSPFREVLGVVVLAAPVDCDQRSGGRIGCSLGRT